MKKLITICLSIFTAVIIAQDAQLTDYTWTLENVIINGQDNFPPSNSESVDIDLSFSIEPYINWLELYSDSSCNYFIGQNIIIDADQSSFTANNGFIASLSTNRLIP